MRDYLARERSGDYQWYLANRGIWADVLARLGAALVDPSVPAEGDGDA